MYRRSTKKEIHESKLFIIIIIRLKVDAIRKTSCLRSFNSILYFILSIPVVFLPYLDSSFYYAMVN